MPPGPADRQKHRFYLDDNGKPVPKARVYQYRDAIAEPIINKYYEDPTLVSFGEDVRDWGGAFAVYRGMTEAIPYYRLFNSPIAEAAIVGAAVGYGMSGGRAIAELMYCDFLGRAGGRSIQPAVQVAGHERRYAEDARGAPHERGLQVRRPA